MNPNLIEKFLNLREPIILQGYFNNLELKEPRGRYCNLHIHMLDRDVKYFSSRIMSDAIF